VAKLRQALSGWNRYPVAECDTWRPERYRGLYLPQGSMIVRGQGRSYGDAALNSDGNVVLNERVNCFIEFNADTGLLRVEPGVTLQEIIDICLPQGWFLAVTPGTKFVSVGGCVAADVHGKNHFRDGAFSAFVRGFDLMLANGETVHCSRDNNTELFRATVGGMGLTGVIGEVALQLKRVETAYLQVAHRKADNLETVFKDLAEPGGGDEYRVAWIDCLARGKRLGRSVTMHGRHARASELPAAAQEEPLVVPPRRQKTMPFNLPSLTLNRFSIAAFNALYYRRAGGRTEAYFTDYDRYFYPLDAIAHWNRMYGRNGFVQYQCVLPEATAFEGMQRILQRLSSSRRPSFLAVLKRLGPASGGLLSFPVPGYTLALDLPLRGKALLPLLDELDERVIQYGGRVYLAKDARLSKYAFRNMYDQVEAFRAVKRRVDPQNHFVSDLARRLVLTV
jgi:FAD/FMN-containing dehydrogenase